MKRFVFVILFAWILSTCGPTAEDIATQTADAAMATFEALPTAMPTPTHAPTFTPTLTATPTLTLTPSLTPTITSSPTNTSTTGRIEGMVMVFWSGLTGEASPIKGAYVELIPYNTTTKTDEQGYYFISELDSGIYQLVFHFKFDPLGLGGATKLPKSCQSFIVELQTSDGVSQIGKTNLTNLNSYFLTTNVSEKYNVEVDDVLQMDVNLICE